MTLAPATLLTGTAIAYGIEWTGDWVDSRPNLGAVGKMDLTDPGLEQLLLGRLAPSLATTNTFQKKKIFVLRLIITCTINRF